MSEGDSGSFADFAHALAGTALIVTASAGGLRRGCLVGFATQASIDPPRLLVCVSVRNATFDAAVSASHLGVHVIPGDRFDLAELFGGETGDDVDKFALTPWEEGPGGEPLLRDCPTRMSGRPIARVELGDHVGFLLDPVAVWAGPAADGLDVRRAAGIDPGHEP
jgi:flavin reductase (DIM6/NTAB) family NADH-FMN oxidoreductase RutF